MLQISKLNPDGKTQSVLCFNIKNLLWENLPEYGISQQCTHQEIDDFLKIKLKEDKSQWSDIVAIDLTKVEQIDSDGAKVIIRAITNIANDGGNVSIVLAEEQNHIRRALGTMGIISKPGMVNDFKSLEELMLGKSATSAVATTA